VPKEILLLNLVLLAIIAKETALTIRFPVLKVTIIIFLVQPIAQLVSCVHLALFARKMPPWNPTLGHAP
jgi:hypothetical protein